ncbi:hypothetical protein GALMADRAFT_217858 [Galerina marginata CBS 339.88]|uniref:BTB domain-containing protein n=1 Tax=Galerina marginata (strain CBS 339.88) TaxID=685588 RepID=A0A067U0C8_GALM3|nr:hypothetical protein GALMADRAFT_217858 [Galerina marginata CBS 339.88]
MSWVTFRCEKPDFQVRSSVDGTTCPVSRAALLNSEVFRDMFASCDPNISEGEVLELQESGGELAALLRLLHHPPSPPSELPVEDKFREIQYDPATVIPLPLLLSLLFRLADKYAITDSVTKALRIHLRANARAHALEVYGFATLHEMDWEASEASQYVLPVASYRFEEIKLIPNVVAYHKLVRLQDFRMKALRDLLLGEDIFPHGYGECSPHREKTSASWDRQRKALVGRIDSATDVAGEMGVLTNTFITCKICHKACTAAVEMLAYKCRRLPRRLDQLPNIY